MTTQSYWSLDSFIHFVCFSFFSLKQVVHHPKEDLKSLPSTSTWVLDREVVYDSCSDINKHGRKLSWALFPCYNLSD